VRLLGLTGDLGLTDHHRVEGGGDSKEVADSGTAEVDVELVVTGKLTCAVGEVGEAAPEVEEQGIGVDARFTAEVELDPVAGAEVDKLRKTSEPGKLDEVFAGKLGRQRCSRQLVHVHGAVRGAYDADVIQALGLPAESLRDIGERFSHTAVKSLEKNFTHPLRKFDGRGTLDNHGMDVGRMGRRRAEKIEGVAIRL